MNPLSLGGGSSNPLQAAATEKLQLKQRLEEAMQNTIFSQAVTIYQSGNRMISQTAQLRDE